MYKQGLNKPFNKVLLQFHFRSCNFIYMIPITSGSAFTLRTVLWRRLDKAINHCPGRSETWETTLNVDKVVIHARVLYHVKEQPQEVFLLVLCTFKNQLKSHRCMIET